MASAFVADGAFEPQRLSKIAAGGFPAGGIDDSIENGFIRHAQAAADAVAARARIHCFRLKSLYERLKEILDRQPEGNGITRLNTIKSIEVRGLGFSYGGYAGTDGMTGRESANGMIAGNRSTVNGFSTLFEKGNMYAVEGENGAGW